MELDKVLANIKDLAKSRRKENKKLVKRLSKVKPVALDAEFHELHEETFEAVDCLACANCCKTTSPIFTRRDVERIAKHQGMKPGAFEEKYLKVDEDEDMVLQSSPCTFLNEDNYCSIYEVRPKACAEYPHTDRKNMVDILDLTIKNTKVCPAVYMIVERMKN